MHWEKALAGGLVGSLIGCGLWIAIGYFTGYEIGILAIGVGLLCGIGVAIGAKGLAGTPGGLLAAALTIVSIVAARYVIMQLSFGDMVREAAASAGNIPGPADHEYWTAYIADHIIKKREQAGETIDWPNDDVYDEHERSTQYPADVWSQAQSQWREFSASDRDQFCEAAKQVIAHENAAGLEDAHTVFSIIGVLYSNFRPMAIVIMAIAVGSAYRVARNSTPANGGADESESFEQAPGQPGIAMMPDPNLRPSSAASATAGPPANIGAPASTGAPRGLPGMPPPGSLSSRPASPASPAAPPSPADSAPTGLPGMPPPGSLKRTFN